MAQLPPDGEWLIQNIGGLVVLFQRYTEVEVVRFNPVDATAVSLAQATIADDSKLTEEQKSWAHFWSGYFYAHATLHGEAPDE